MRGSGGRVFAGLSDGQIWASPDHGDSWARCTLRGDPLGALSALALAV